MNATSTTLIFLFWSHYRSFSWHPVLPWGTEYTVQYGKEKVNKRESHELPYTEMHELPYTEMHELPYTEMLKSGTSRLASGMGHKMGLFKTVLLHNLQCLVPEAKVNLLLHIGHC